MSSTASTAAVVPAVDTYFAAWNEPDAERRLALATEAWTDQGRYLDPQTDVTGPAGFSEMVGAVRLAYPGISVRRVSAVETHHDQVRFAWEIVQPGGDVALAGIDVGQLAENGRLQSIVGFFGVAPAAGTAEDAAGAEADQNPS